MLVDISKDFYCSANKTVRGRDDIFVSCLSDFYSGCTGCCNLHRKHPTLEQFKKEYGEKWTGAVYAMCSHTNKPCNEFCEEENKDCVSEWILFKDMKYACRSYCDDAIIYIVCACTPYGKPDKDWRPS